MSLDDLLRKAKTATTEAHSELAEPLVSVPGSGNDGLSLRHRQLRYLVEFDKTTYTAEEIAELLPELQAFASQAPRRLTSEVALPDEVLDELSKHFDHSIDLDEWLQTPNDIFEGKSPLDISQSRLMKTLKGLI
jgi:hypothetical protein